ncbi:Inactive (p)ppGpp 3'-pyrophosphohydrolase domain / GTP pyrophosphokinase, (p)ppGpp synthetase I [hydrothermal vent metagenome]|uniref:Inactive (P)ppGpp 3'-pyrophosphohydrolase domain / GTP pyrophosphokinase, (P)ppGpp synthetase I n=1 Tax=hydrothermal vent metagenome TaxID=652676 RepID=A0A3B0XVH7_9ZZZZ
MQSTKNTTEITQLYTLEAYLKKLTTHCGADEHISQACELLWELPASEEILPGGLEVALILADLNVDKTTLVVTLLGDFRLNKDEFIASISDRFGDEIYHLVKKVRWLHEFHFTDTRNNTPEQTERLRRMLLSVVDDVRVMLIKLAYRVQRLRMLAGHDTDLRKVIARETLEIFTPLANRLGIGQLKWEMEDLSFRFLEPLTYKRIARLLDQRREERESYISNAVESIRLMLEEASIKGDVSGRPKHIYSIWKKMTAKHKAFDELFDVRAVRITLESVEDCYLVLGLVHSRWRHIAREFDDYVANPKENGYRSLHTAVFGPQGKPLEIQIRTVEMHEFAEHGVAAHWRYKEGSASDDRLEQGIASLRKLLDPDETQDEELIDSFHTELFADRVFVLTPEGKVIDLPRGATPLDFAYIVHTEIGHRCRGAKVQGRIVQLTYELKNGEQVEILTSNVAAPARDWMNPNLGYLKTKRARAKVKSWFKQQDYEQNRHDGKACFERALNRIGLQNVSLQQVQDHYKTASTDDLYATIGRGDITSGQLENTLHNLFSGDKEKTRIPLHPSKATHSRKSLKSDGIRIRGVANLLTTIANCCKPVPGDQITGFITQGQGVTVHRVDCANIINLDESRRDRLIEASWGDALEQAYAVEIHVEAFDRQGLLSDVSKVLSDEKVDVIGLNTLSNKDEQTADMTIMVEITDLEQLGRVMDRINQLQNVVSVSRSRV